MNKKTIYFLLALTISFVSGFVWWKLTPPKNKIITLKSASFKQLPGWDSADTRVSLKTFLTSCKTLLRQNPQKSVGSEHIPLQAKDWSLACRAAQSIDVTSIEDSKTFFERWFSPVEFYNGKRLPGVFTGYYVPTIKGSLVKTPQYSVPLYGLPNDLVQVQVHLFNPKLKREKIIGRVVRHELTPYFTREQINQGAIKNTAPVLAWIHSPIDRNFLEIEGSGTIELDNGQHVLVGYAAENGAKYTSIASVLIKKGLFTKETASTKNIRNYLKAHSGEMDKTLNQNQSFVFFRVVKDGFAVGAQGVPLTPGYSLAVDRAWIPLGAPVWLSTKQPDKDMDKQKSLKRLMVAQDTGGAIRGAVRGDIYYGPGKTAKELSNHMKHMGHYWLLMPKSIA